MVKPVYHRFIFLFIIILLLFPSLCVGASQNEYLIRLSDSLSIELQTVSLIQRIEFIKQLLRFYNNVEVLQVADVSDINVASWYLIRGLDSKTNQMEIAGNSSYLEHIQENHAFKVYQNLPNDPYYSEQWYHLKVQAFQSWRQYTPNEDIILAVIDTGVDYNHTDLAGSIWVNPSEDLNQNGIFDSGDFNDVDDDGNGYVDDVIGWDFTDAPRYADGGDYIDPDNDPMDEYLGGHGTRIAGIITAQTANSAGVAALTPGMNVMNLRAGTAGGYLEEDDVARAVLYAMNNGARVINMSFGDVVISRFLQDVINYAYSEGIIIVASSGNSGTDEIQYPSGLPQTISVGATDRSDQLAGFSNWGTTVDLVAPGVDILTPRAGGGYDTVNGTSFSAPMVTATAGLLLSNMPDYSPEQIRNILKTSADDIGIRGWDEQTGSGRLNMNRASLTTKKSSLIVEHPASGTNVAADSLPIIISATDPDLTSLTVSFGLGKDPADWINLVSGYPYQIVSDTIFVFPIASLPDSTGIIKLSMESWSGETLEYYSVFSIDRTAPKISNIKHSSILDGNEYKSLIEFKTDDVTSADIYYRSLGGNESFEVVHMEYETTEHYHLFEFSNDIEYYIRTTNLSKLSSIDNNQNQYYKILNPGKYIIEEDFYSVNYKLPSGFMLDEAVDLDGDGNFEVVISEYDEFNAFGPVTIYEYSQGEFLKQFETPFKGIPRSFGDSDSDGKLELLIGYGQQSYLLEATQPGNWPTEVVWTDTGDIWVSKITDLDADGLFEIIGKKGTSFVMLESLGDNQYEQKFVFENFSPGENQLGPPRCEVTDLDADGNLEIYYGDYDGDIVIYENSGNDLFESKLHINLPLRDATNYFSSGKFSSPENRQLIAGTHSGNSTLMEHEIEGLYWNYSIVSSGQDGYYRVNQKIKIHGYGNVRDFESGINTGSIVNGEPDYLFLTPYPDLYLFKWDGDGLIPVWYKSDVNSNTILVHDFDQNGVSEFYINNGEMIVGFEKNLSQRPRPPVGFEAYPLDTSKVFLKWDRSEDADRYVIYRGPDLNNLVKYDSTSTDIFYIDSSVVKGKRYYYAVQTVGLSFAINQSALSPVLDAIPNNPPTVETLIVKNNSQIEVYFSEFMDLNTLKTKNFVIRSEDNPSTSAVAFLNGQAVLLSFSNQLLTNMEYHLELVALRDTNKTPLPENESLQTFKYNFNETQVPYISEWKYESDRMLVLTFNVPMDLNTISNLSNYTLEPSGSVEVVEPMNESDQIFRLQLSNNTYGLRSGVTTYLSLHNLQSLQGNFMEEGNRIALVATSENLNNMMVYPQPATIEEGWVTFSNIVDGTSIRIFDINGHFITSLEEKDQNGGVRWDLRDAAGSVVSSGVYIYYATFDNQTKLGKFTIIK